MDGLQLRCSPHSWLIPEKCFPEMKWLNKNCMQSFTALGAAAGQ